MRYIALITLILFLSCKNNDQNKETTSIKLGKYNTTEPTPLMESMQRGAALYKDFCMQCHMADGKGVEGTFPPVAGSDWLTDNVTESIRAVKYGQSGEIVVNGVTYNGVMVTMGLSDEEVSDVMNYVLNSWGNTSDEMITPEQVSEIEK